jgi:uncharacterized protein YydD (DUF2326 family)
MLVEIYCDKFKTGGKNGKTRPAITFHEGLNAVIGDEDRSNSIGKSTLLMIIDFVFGGKDYINKCLAVQENVKEHNICFTLKFNGVEYSFIRNTVKYGEVIRCNRQYIPYEDETPINIDEYTSFLTKMYDLDFEGLSWRGLMSKHIRVHGRDTMDASRPLQEAKDGKVSDDIKRYLKQFRKYTIVEKQINQAKTAEEEKEAFRKSVGFHHIRMASCDKEYKENEAKVAELLVKKNELAENSSKGLLDLSSIQAQKLDELNSTLVSYTRQRARVQTQLNSLRKEMTEGKKTFKKSYSDLERFFPGTEFKEIAKIEKFHQSLSKVLQDEFKESEADLATTYVMLSNEISKIKEQIAETENIPNVTKAVLKEYARISTELNNLQAANEKFKTFDELKKTAKEYAKTRDEIIARELSDIQSVLNDKMKEITVEIVRDKNLIPPKLKLEKMNSYSFETKGDDGSGAGQRGLITFDLANMATSNIPFVIHDADLMDPIEKPILTELIKYYDSVKKQKRQVFVSFRSYEFYAEEIRPTLEKCKVTQLEAGGQELFGWAWNKEKQNEQGE